jgi:hypothetical protein
LDIAHEKSLTTLDLMTNQVWEDDPRDLAPWNSGVLLNSLDHLLRGERLAEFHSEQEPHGCSKPGSRV